MSRSEKAATIVRRAHGQLISHPFEQIGERLLRLSHLPVVRCGSHGRDDPLLFVADLRTKTFVAHARILLDATTNTLRRRALTPAECPQSELARAGNVAAKSALAPARRGFQLLRALISSVGPSRSSIMRFGIDRE